MPKHLRTYTPKRTLGVSQKGIHAHAWMHKKIKKERARVHTRKSQPPCLRSQAPTSSRVEIAETCKPKMELTMILL